MENSAAERIANIGAAERRKRLAIGIGALCVAAVKATLLVLVGAPLVWRLPLFFLFYLGALALVVVSRVVLAIFDDPFLEPVEPAIGQSE